jgi:hypothetical protein
MGRKSGVLARRGTTPPSPPRLFIQSQKRNSRKFVSKILHSPGPMGPATLDSPGPVPNPKPYMLWWCIKIRSGAYPALR